MDESLTPQPVRFLPTPTGEGQSQAMFERREFSKKLAEAAARIKGLEEVAYIDPKTKLPNLAVFEKELPRVVEVAHENDAPLALLLIDIDGLHRTNKEVGVEAGDDLLRSVGTVLQGILRDGDVAGRLGGDEFYGILPGYERKPDQTIEELNSERETRLKTQFVELAKQLGIPPELYVGITVGIAILKPGDTPDTFLRRAHQELSNKKGALYSSLAELNIHFEDERDKPIPQQGE